MWQKGVMQNCGLTVFWHIKISPHSSGLAQDELHRMEVSSFLVCAEALSPFCAGGQLNQQLLW